VKKIAQNFGLFTYIIFIGLPKYKNRNFTQSGHPDRSRVFSNDFVEEMKIRKNSLGRITSDPREMCNAYLYTYGTQPNKRHYTGSTVAQRKSECENKQKPK
jgi:hypothetical protein